MDKYRLDLLHEDDFETLVIRICRDILGIGVMGFASGKDGGRDGRFEGKANKYPSEESWFGKFIIQAKHTTDSQASCSDNTFFGNQTSVIAKEIKNIKALKDENEVDNYICLTNRKITGGTESEIRKNIIEETGVENVAILGIEFIEANLTKDIIREFKLNKHILSFEFYEQDIRDVIKIFSEELSEETGREPITIEALFRDVRPEGGIVGKNKLNDLSQEYFDNEIRYNSLEYFEQIDKFLKDPINKEYSKQYRNTTRELNNLILIRRSDFEKFEEVFLFIYHQIFKGKDDELKEHRDLIYVFLHFMYFQCDIGRNQ